MRAAGGRIPNRRPPLERSLGGLGACCPLACALGRVRLPLTPWSAAHQAPLSMRASQARILERIAISYSRGSSRPREQTLTSCISCTGRRILYHCTTWNVSHNGSQFEKKKIIHLNDLDKSQTSFHLEEIQKILLRRWRPYFHYSICPLTQHGEPSRDCPKILHGRARFCTLRSAHNLTKHSA